METGWLFLEILIVNIILSGDNAVVIAMASKNLPASMRDKAIWLGTAGAILLRILLTGAAVYFLQVPYIQGIGALLLVYIAIRLLMDEQEQEMRREVYSFRAVVWTIIAADFVMSLDNVLAVAAIAAGNIPLLIVGIVLSIPLIIWGSTFIIKLLERFPVLIFFGAAILGYTAGEMFVNEQQIQHLFEGVHESFDWFIPLLFTMVVIGAGLMKASFSKTHKK